MRKLSSISAAMATSLLMLASAQAQPASAVDAKLTKERISADYKLAMATCDKFSGNAKDICVEEAKGNEKVSLAELEYQRSGKTEDMNKVTLAKAEAAYELAKERCDDKSGNDKDVCLKEAKAAEVRAKANVKASKDTAVWRKDTVDDKRDAEYKLAKEKCDALSGDAKSSCVAAAKARFGK